MRPGQTPTDSPFSPVRAFRFTLCTLLLPVLLFAQSASSQQFTLIHVFTTTDNLNAGTSLARDQFGNLYGASTLSALQCAGGISCGAIYKITAAGQLSTLYRFQGPPDGTRPNAVVSVAGVSITNPATLYGTTMYGGTSASQDCDQGAGCGTVFKLSSNGEEAILHSFTAPPNDGILPSAGVIAEPGPTPGSGEVLYGTTYYGGPYSMNGLPGEGTVFQIANGVESVLYDFTGRADGALPFAPLLFRQGALYGTTVFGGSGSCVTSFGSGCGTVFKIVGTHESVLYSFNNQADGGFPSASLIADSAGNLYGTAVLGGDLNCQPGGSGLPPGCGTVFKLSPSGQQAVLYTFHDGADGAWPSAALVMDSAGNLYGTATLGGNLSCAEGQGCGTVFKIDTAGTFSVLHTFEGSDGSYPLALIQDNQGNLYGVAQSGGSADDGVVYKLTP
jgi:uncharacterized repeat protein (TIGR03803 family)